MWFLTVTTVSMRSHCDIRHPGLTEDAHEVLPFAHFVGERVASLLQELDLAADHALCCHAYAVGYAPDVAQRGPWEDFCGATEPRTGEGASNPGEESAEDVKLRDGRAA